MKNRERKRLRATYGSLYTPHHFEKHEASQGCFYCGDVRESLDHVPPLSWVEARRMEDWRRDGITLITVPCCAWCNGALLDRPLFNLRERAEFIEARLMKLHERQSTLWSEEDINEMSSEFQRTIRARQRATKVLLIRARAAEWRALMEAA